LTAVIIVAAGLGGLFTFQWAFDEAIEMQDSVLTQIGTPLQHGAQPAPSETPLAGVKSNAEVVITELGTAPRGAADDRRLWGLQDGLRTDNLRGRPVRLLLATRPDGSRFVVAQQTAIRDEIAGDLAIRALVPIAALIPGLMLVTAFVISRSLRPVERLAARLNARQANDLHKLPIEDNLRELHPFIASINGLLDRIRLMVDQQSRFIADAAHELRTPVTALSLQAENFGFGIAAGRLPHALGHTEGGHRTHQASARTIARTRPPRHAPIRRTWARCARPGCKGGCGRPASGGL
jgi:two-component system, OmpR family, sensor kinase